MEWDESLDVRVQAMNDEHIELIRLMNIVFEVNGNGRDAVGASLSDLVNYTVEHFDNEEAYMESVGFDGLKTHKLIHKSLLERVGEFVEEFTTSGSDVLPDDLFDFLKFWLVTHIKGIDTKYTAADSPATAGATAG